MWGVVVSGGVVFGVGGRVRWVGWPWGGSAGVLVASVCRMVGVAHSCAFGVGGSSGIVRKSNFGSGRGPVPMCVDPLGAHGSKTAARDDRWKIPLFQQEPASPYRGPSLPCATSKTTDARQVHPPRPAPRSVRNPCRDRFDSTWPARRRGTHDELEGESRMPHLGTINT